MSGKTCYQNNIDVILNRAKDFYENDKETLGEEARDKYKNLSEEEKGNREYGRSRYHNMSEEKKKHLKGIKKITVRPKKVKRLDLTWI